MIVYIKLFGNVKEVEYKFTNGGVVVLSGEGGIGKTSVLRAVKWCLYGGSVDDGGAMHVTVKYGNVTIVRTSPPNAIAVDAHQRMNGALADEYIASIFGSRRLFDVACHVKARSPMSAPNPLFDSNDSVRLNALSTLVFDETSGDPNAIIDKIKRALKDSKRVAKDAKAAYVAARAELDLKGKLVYPLDVEVDESTLEANHAAAMQALANRHKLEGELASLVSRRSTLTTSLASLEHRASLDDLAASRLKPSLTQDELVALETRIKQSRLRQTEIKALLAESSRELKNREMALAAVVARNTRVREIQDQMRAFQASGHAVPPLLDTKEYHQLIYERKKYDQHTALCAAYGIAYKRDSIDGVAATARQVSEYRRAEKGRQLYDSVRARVESTAEHDVSAMEATLVAMKTSLNVIKCPCCMEDLVYSGGTLRRPARGGTTAKDIQLQESRIKQARSSNAERDKLARQLSELSKYASWTPRADFDTYAFDVDRVVSDMSQMSTLVATPLYSESELDSMIRLRSMGWTGVVEHEVDDSGARASLELQLDVVASRESELASLDSALSSLTTQYSIELKRKADADSVHGRIASTKAEIKSRRGEVSAIAARIASIEKTINVDCVTADAVMAIQHSLVKLRDYKASLRQQDRVDALKREAERTTLIAARHATLLHESVDEHYHRLSDLVEALNVHIAAMTPKMFDIPMSIKLILYNVDSKKKAPKHSVALDIVRRGLRVKSVDAESMAESEKQRVLLLIVLSVGLYNGWRKTPLLLLDETMNSMSENQRAICLSLLRETNLNRTVLITEHFVMPQHYDQCIEL